MWLKIESYNYKNNIIEKVIRVSFILYILDIFLISKIGNNSIMRLQDVASVLALVSIIYILKESKKTNIFYNKIASFILLFLIYIIITNSIYYLIGNINLMSIFYIGKEIEFYLCFYIVSYIFLNDNNNFANIIEILIVMTLLYGIYLVMTGNISYYGIGTIFESAPSVSGSIYFVTSIYSYYIYRSHHISRFRLYSLIAYLMTLFTVSKTNIIGLTFFYLLYYSLDFIYGFFFKLRGKKDNFMLINTNKILIILVLSLLIFISIIFILNIPQIRECIFANVLIEKILNRFDLFGSSYSFRSNKSKYYLDHFIQYSPIAFLFGRGKGIAEFTFNSSTLAVDNQFVRSIIEMGIIGILLWLLPIISTITTLKKYKKRFSYNLGISLFLSYLVMGVGYEVFAVTKTGIIYWFLIGVFIGDKKTNKISMI